MVDFAVNPATATSAHDKILQDKINAAHGRILHVMQVVGDNPTAHVPQKIADLELLADINEAYLTGDVTLPATGIARAAIGGKGTGTNTPPATSNPADLLRITELEKALSDLNSKVGVSGHLLTTNGKIDVGPTVKSILDEFDKLKATPPAPVDAVPKKDVAATAAKIKVAVTKLKANVLKGGRIEGLDDLNKEIADLEKLAPSTP